MIVGYSPGQGLLHRAHPFTTLALAAAVAVLAFALPGPVGPAALVVALVLLALIARVPRALVTAMVMAIPFWFFLLLIYAVFDDAVARAVTLGARVTAILVSFLIVLASLHPGRLVDALLARGIPFSAAYLFSATIQAVPRLRDRARAILDAQRCRGLRVRGSLWRRIAAVVPLAVPLVLGALAEVDERTLALEARGTGSAQRRTPLDPPRDTMSQRLLRWTLIAAAITVVLVRILA